MIFCTGENDDDDDNGANCRIDDRRDRPYSLSTNENAKWEKGPGSSVCGYSQVQRLHMMIICTGEIDDDAENTKKDTFGS